MKPPKVGGEQIRWAFVVCALAVYAIYAILTPPFETPDEQQHLFRAYQLSRLQMFGEKRGDTAGGMVPEAMYAAAGRELDLSAVHAERAVRLRSWSTLFQPDEPLSSDGTQVYANFLGAVLYAPVGYLPQVVSIWIGTIFHNSVDNTVRLGRLLNASVAILLIAFAMRIHAPLRPVLVYFGLLPMTAATCASFGQDASTIGLASLLTAIGLRLTSDRRWSWRLETVSVVSGIGLALAKIVYWPLMLIPILSPPRKMSKARWACSRLVWASLAVAVTLVWIYAVRDLVVPPRATVGNVGVQMRFMLDHPWRAAQAVIGVYGTDFQRLAAEVVGAFGWLTIYPQHLTLTLVSAAAILVLITSDGEPFASPRNRLTWLAIVAIVAIGISAIMYAYYSPPGSSTVLGVQGRYLLPMLPLLFAAARDPRLPALPERVTHLPLLLLMVSANAISLRQIAFAFYS